MESHDKTIKTIPNLSGLVWFSRGGSGHFRGFLLLNKEMVQFDSAKWMLSLEPMDVFSRISDRSLKWSPLVSGCFFLFLKLGGEKLPTRSAFLSINLYPSSLVLGWLYFATLTFSCASPTPSLTMLLKRCPMMANSCTRFFEIPRGSVSNGSFTSLKGSPPSSRNSQSTEIYGSKSMIVFWLRLKWSFPWGPESWDIPNLI